MNFLTRILILVLCIIASVFIALPFALDNSSLKFQIEQKVSQKLSNNFEIKGDVNIAFLPIPKIVIHNANLNNFSYGENMINLRTKAITIQPEFFALLRGKMKIGKLIFDSPQTELNLASESSLNDDKDNKSETAGKAPKPPNKAKFSDKIFNIKNLNEETLSFKNINKIKVINGSFFRHESGNKISLEFNKIEFELKNNLRKHSFNINGNFFSGELPTEFKMVIDTNKGRDSSLIVNSPILKLDLNGKFDNSQIDNLVKANFAGKFNAEIINLKAVLSKYFSKNSLIYNKINSTKSIKISANITGQDGEMKANDIVINSQLVSGSGEIDANFGIARPAIDANITLNNIDIDSIWVNGINNGNEESVKSQNSIIGNFLNSQNGDPEKTKLLTQDKIVTDAQSAKSDESVDLTAEINIKNAKYMDGEIKDVSLYFIMSGEGKILLQPLLMKVPGNGMLRINGVFEDQDSIPKFIGKIDSGGKNLQQLLSWLKIDPQNLKPNSLSDYAMISDILLLPNFLVLSNFYVSINNNKNLLAGYIKYENSTGIPSIRSDFIINDLNVEDYFLIADKNQYLSSGPLLQKLLWLNSNSANTSLSLLFNKLTYKQSTFFNQPLKMEFGQGYFKLNDLKLKSNDINIQGFLNVNITNNNPIIDINLNAENFRYITTKPAETQDAKEAANFKSGFLQQFFNLPSLDNFNGSISINVANLMIDQLAINNVKVAGKLKNGELALDDAGFDLYNGNLKYTGNVILKSSKAFNGTFTLTNIDNRNFLDDLLGINNVTGLSNISGVVAVVGKNRDEFYKNLDMQLKFVSGNILVKGFGIDDLLKKMLAPYQYKAELHNPLNILFGQNNKSYFREISGKLDIRRNNRDNKLRIETTSTGINSVTTGSVDLANNIFNGSSNFIFLTGSRQRQIPINIAINYNGKFGNIASTANIDQVNQYLKSVNGN
jgi:AsmA family